MEPQSDFPLITQCLTEVVEQISSVPNIPTISDGQTVAQQLQQITQSLAQQGDRMTTILNTITTLQAEVGTIKDSIANLDLRLDAR